MTRFIAEFVLDSDIRLPDGSEPITWENGEDAFSFTIFNNKKGFSLVEEALTAHLVFSAPDLSDAKERCQDILAMVLNSLVWTSVSMIRQAKLVRVVDWSPGKTMRDALVFHETPKIAVSVPTLIPEMLETASKLFESQKSPRTQAALRWFRLGISADVLEDQFTYLWFSVETAAEALKSSGMVTTKCPVCDDSLFCAKCDSYPLHRKFSADAIKELIITAFPNEEFGIAIFRALVKIRHTLMHGRRMESVVSSLPFDGKAATNYVASVARNAILRMSDFSKYEAKELALALVESEDIVRGNLIAAAQVQTIFGTDPNKPTLSGGSGIKISIRYPGQPDD